MEGGGVVAALDTISLLDRLHISTLLGTTLLRATLLRSILLGSTLLGNRVWGHQPDSAYDKSADEKRLHGSLSLSLSLRN